MIHPTVKMSRVLIIQQGEKCKFVNYFWSFVKRPVMFRYLHKLMMLHVDNQRMDLTEPSSMGDKSSSMKRAEEIQANLAAENPSFVKSMLKSHVTGGFWLVSHQNL